MKTRHKMKRRMPRIRTILIAGATLYIVLSTFVATVNHVPTTSMENTIKAGSVILIDQITYGASCHGG